MDRHGETYAYQTLKEPLKGMVISMKNITLYVDQDTFLTRIHPYTKLLYILTAVMVSILSHSFWVYGLFIIASLLILSSSKLIRRSIPLIAFSFTLLIMIFIVQGIFNQKNATVLLSIGPVHFYQEGLLYASRIGLNVLNMLLSFACFVLSTKPSDLVEEMEKSGFPPRFGYVISSVFQIIPQMTGTMNTITDAQRSRGMETEGKLRVRIKAFIPLIAPVVMSSLINTRERAIALEVRGFDSKEKKTYLSDREKRKSDRYLNIFFGLMILATVAWRVILWLQ